MNPCENVHRGNFPTKLVSFTPRLLAVILGLALAASVAGGCVPTVHERSQTFRVVDAGTRQPVGGVAVSRASFAMDARLPGEILDKAYGETGTDGLITTPDLLDRYVNSVQFDKAGYRSAVVTIGPDHGRHPGEWNHARVLSPLAEGRIQPSVRMPLEQTLVIPLHRDPNASQPR
jgi:hypothetical protein